MNAQVRRGTVGRGSVRRGTGERESVGRAGDQRSNAAPVFRRGDMVIATQHLGRRVWRSGVPIGTVGVVVDTDWLGDLRVKFTLGGAWFAGKCTVEKLVTPCEIRPAPSRN